MYVPCRDSSFRRCRHVWSKALCGCMLMLHRYTGHIPIFRSFTKIILLSILLCLPAVICWEGGAGNALLGRCLHKLDRGRSTAKSSTVDPTVYLVLFFSVLMCWARAVSYRSLTRHDLCAGAVSYRSDPEIHDLDLADHTRSTNLICPEDLPRTIYRSDLPDHETGICCVRSCNGELI